jgi:hypothetical protein
MIPFSVIKEVNPDEVKHGHQVFVAVCCEELDAHRGSG